MWISFSKFDDASVWQCYRKYIKGLCSAESSDFGSFCETVMQFSNEEILSLSDILELEESKTQIEDILLALCLYGNVSRLSKLKFLMAVFGRHSKGSISEPELKLMITRIHCVIQKISGEREARQFRESVKPIGLCVNERYCFDDFERVFRDIAIPGRPSNSTSKIENMSTTVNGIDPRFDPDMRGRFMEYYKSFMHDNLLEG
jgi:hypothetical protein